MKKVLISLILLILITFQSTFAAEPIEVYFLERDGHYYKQSFYQEPILDNGRVLVEFRHMFSKLGMDVSWDAKKQLVTAKNNETTIELVIGSNIAKVNQKNIKLDVPAKVVRGRTVVPLRFVSETANAKVNWKQTERKVLIAPSFLNTKRMFHDPLLEQAVRRALNGKEPTAENVKAITTLNGFLGTCGYFEDHISMTYPENPLLSLAGIEYLTNLEDLKISCNRLTDIEAVGKLRSLKKFTIMGEKGEIKDLTPLVQLPELEELNIIEQQVTDLSVLSKIKSLKTLAFSQEDFKNYESLKLLTQLESLNLFSASLNNIDFVKPLKNLKSLSINQHNVENKVSDLSPLTNLTKLEHLSLYSSDIRTLKPLENLENLRELYVAGKQINSLSSLERLTQLEILMVNDTQVSSLESLKPLIKLKQLYIANNRITSIDPLLSLENLEVISLGYSYITTIPAGVTNLPKLEQFLLTENLINTNDETTVLTLTALEEKGVMTDYHNKHWIYNPRPLPVVYIPGGNYDNRFYANEKYYPLTQKPYLQTGTNRIMVPLRMLSEALGTEVEWQTKDQSITLQKGDITIQLKIGSNITYVNGKPITIDAVPEVKMGTTYVPIRFITEQYGLEIERTYNSSIVLY